MADNTVLSVGTGGDTIASDDISGVKHQRVKVEFGVDGSATDVSASDPLPTAAAGTIAHDAVETGNPLAMGALAVVAGTSPAAVASGDRVRLIANLHGVPYVMAGHPNIQTVRLQFTSAQTNVAIATCTAGQKIAVTALQVTLDNASTVFPLVRIGFATATTPTTTGVLAAHGGIPAGGGFSRGDGSGILGIGADDEDVRITTVGAATGNGVEVVLTYFILA